MAGVSLATFSASGSSSVAMANSCVWPAVISVTYYDNVDGMCREQCVSMTQCNSQYVAGVT